MLNSLITPEQSFYPITITPINHSKPPGLDLSSLKESVVLLKSKMQDLEEEQDV